LKSIDISLI